jgi:hypothetical protein
VPKNIRRQCLEIFLDSVPSDAFSTVKLPGSIHPRALVRLRADYFPSFVPLIGIIIMYLNEQTNSMDWNNFWETNSCSASPETRQVF